MSILQGQPLQLPELGLHVAPSKVVAWAKSTLEKVRALPALGQDVNILHFQDRWSGDAESLECHLFG